MNIFSFLFLLLIAFITGAIGARIAGRRRLGCLASMVLGFIGALIGTYIARQLNLPLSPWVRFGSHAFPVIWAVLGAALFVAFLNLISGKR
ncbi:MAG: GlsB/YeaQ/YmgE family stress response membrane protein [Candidatus Aminicenantes bacterium]